MKQMIIRLVREEEGQGLAEYGLILALIAAILFGVLTVLGEQVYGLFSTLTTELEGLGYTGETVLE